MMLTIVIPTLNAAAFVGPCLAALGAADEIIVADGGSTDGTAQAVRAAGAHLVAAARGRGPQMRAGAEVARGDWLLFLHADTIVGAGWRAVVERHVATTPDLAGYFDLRLDDGAWQARVIERAVALRARLFGLPYGDQGLLISRRQYDEVGGFRPLALMEDVDLARRIGRRRLSRVAAPALTSADRWRRDGWLRRSSRNLTCLALYSVGLSPAQLERFYR